MKCSFLWIGSYLNFPTILISKAVTWNTLLLQTGRSWGFPIKKPDTPEVIYFSAKLEPNKQERPTEYLRSEYLTL